MMRKIAKVALVLAFVTLLAGCSIAHDLVAGPKLQGESAYNNIVAQLKRQASAPTATVELSEIPGSWTKGMIVCRGLTLKDESAALGVPVPNLDPNTAGYGYLLLASDRSVDEYYVARSDEDSGMVDHWVFSLCPSIPGYKISAPIIFQRADRPRLVFSKKLDDSQGATWWEVTPEALADLELRSRRAR